MRLTDVSIRALPTPERGQVIHLDTVIKGFGVRVSQGGAKTFVLTYGKERRRVTLGRVGVVPLVKARELARTHLAERTLGKFKPLFFAYADARDAFLKALEERNRPSTITGYRSRLQRVTWDRSNLADINPRSVLAEIKRFEGPMERRYAFVVLRRFFNWCTKQHHIDVSPMVNLETPAKNSSRERVLSPAELKAIWHACPDDDFGKIVKVLMLTGQRRGEVEHMQLDGDLVTIPAEHTKNKRTHTFPVPSEAQKCLATPLSWSGWGKSTKRLFTAAKVENATLHDLRRTYSTTLGSLRVPPHIIEALLNHKTGVISGVAATYNRYLYLDEMREAVAKFEAWITPVTSATVTPPG